MTAILIKLAVRLVVFTVVFWFAAKKNPKIIIKPRWATPLVAGAFALLNVALYWALKPILNLATLGAVGFVMPLVVNLLLFIATVKLFEKKQWLRIDGIVTYLWMAVLLTATHGVLWVALDYLPANI